VIGTVHIVGLEHILDSDTLQYVHHFTLYGSYADNSSMMIWAWAPGIEPLILPQDVGFLAGVGPNSIKGLKLETHYNNPNLDTGKFDSSGIRIYYTSILRSIDAGVLQVGDSVVTQNVPIPSGNGYSTYEYDCPAECTNKWNYLIQLFSSMLHMHGVGAQIWSTQWRNDVKVRDINRIEYWDFKFQQQTTINITLEPGDRISLNCVYKQQSSPVNFGIASSSEMCMHYISYYPRLPGNSICSYFYDNYVTKQNFTYCNNAPQSFRNPYKTDPLGGDKKTFGIPNYSGYTCNHPNIKTSIIIPSTTATTSTSSVNPSSTTTGGTATTGESNNSYLVIYSIIFCLLVVII